MAKLKMNTYWVLLLAVLFLGSSVLSVGQTQARYTGDTTVVNTVVLTESEKLTSNLLVSDVRQIILLGELNQFRSVEAGFTLKALQPVKDTIYWYVTENDVIAVEIGFEMTEGKGTLYEDATLEMETNSEALVTLTITSVSEITEEKTVDVVVLCENLTGTFRVVLTPETGEDTTEPSEGEDEETTEPTDPTEGENTEPTDPTEGESTEPTDPTEGENTEPTDPTEGENTEPTDPTEGEITEPTDPTEGENTEPTDPTEGENTEPTDPTEGEITEPTDPTESENTEPTDPTEGENTESTDSTENENTEPVDSAAEESEGTTEPVAEEPEHSDDSGEEETTEPVTTEETTVTEEENGTQPSEESGNTDTGNAEDNAGDGTETPADGSGENTETPADGSGENTETPDDGSGENTETPDDGSGENTETPDDGSGEGTETPDDGNGENTETPDDGSGENTETPDDGNGEGTDPPDDGTDDPPEDPEDNAGETTDPEGDPETDAVSQVVLKTFGEFERTATLPVSILVGGKADRLTIGLAGGNPLPALTRYSPDGGNTWYLLYFGGYITIDDGFEALEVAEALNWFLQLDFSGTSLETGTEILLEARGMMGEQVSGTGTATAKMVADSVKSSVPQILTKTKTVEETAVMTAEAETQAETLAQPEKDSYFVVTLPVGWDSCFVEYEVAFLRAGEKGNTYEPVVITDLGGEDAQMNTASLYGKLDYQTRTLTIGLGDALPAAGTYRLTIKGSYEGVCFQQMQMTFFINYSTRSDAE